MTKPTLTVSCPVDTRGDYGVYANAFRVLQDGPDVLLDFCVYSEQERSARVVSRIRVPPSFLLVVLARLQSSVEVSDGEGRKLYIMPESKEIH